MPEAARTRIIRIVEGAPRVLDDGWRIVEAEAEWLALRAAPRAARGEGVLLPLELALAHAPAVAEGEAFGVWLAPAEDPARAVPLFAQARLVGVRFPTFTDGRGYTTAALLRSRLGWRGELRAFGDVLQDQLFALRRVGFDSFALRPDRDPVAALRGFSVFSGTYQGSVDQPLPAYRRASFSA